MRDTGTGSEGPEDGDEDDGVPMTILAVNGGYWLYEGRELLDDMLFGSGAYPFRVRCVHFKDAIELRQFFGDEFSIASLWRINPDVIARLRREGLLFDISPQDDE